MQRKEYIYSEGRWCIVFCLVFDHHTKLLKNQVEYFFTLKYNI